MFTNTFALLATKHARTLGTAFYNFDPSKKIANHLVGKHHSKWHRRSVGTIIIMVGVGIAEIPLSGTAHFAANAIGYLIHALGGMAFLSPIEAAKDE